MPEHAARHDRWTPAFDRPIAGDLCEKCGIDPWRFIVTGTDTAHRAESIALYFCHPCYAQFMLRGIK